MQAMHAISNKKPKTAIEALGNRLPMNKNLSEFIPSNIKPIAVYHRVNHCGKVFHSSHYPKSRNNSSQVALTKNGGHIFIDIFALTTNCVMFVIGRILPKIEPPQSSENLLKMFNPSLCPCASNILFSHFHWVNRVGTEKVIALPVYELVSRCIVYFMTNEVWLLCDYIDDFEHD